MRGRALGRVAAAAGLLAAAAAAAGWAAAPAYRDDAAEGESRKIEMEGRYTEEYRPPPELAPPDIRYWYDHPGPPELGMGMGVSFYWADLGGVNHYLDEIEEMYRRQGHPIPGTDRRSGSINMAWYTMRFWYWRPLAAQLDVGSSTGSDIKINGLTASATYLPAIPGLRWLRPYGAVGVTFLQFKSVVDYAPAIYPERLTASGSSWGLVARQGVQIWPPSRPREIRFSASLYLEYVLSPDMVLEHPSGISREASFQGRSAGLRVEIVL